MKNVARRTFRAVGYDVKRVLQAPPDPEVLYHANGRVPWSRGYHQARFHYIEDALADATLIDAFRRGLDLPAQYGVGLDERCVEYPWVLSLMSCAPERLLDAGSALNHSTILHQPALQSKQIHILTLYPEFECFWRSGVSYLFHDLRDIPIREDFYDIITCISTLEHIGMDNSLFAGRPEEVECRLGDFTLAVRELKRVLRGGGRLLVTVPYGENTNIGSMQQFDAGLVQNLISTFDPAACEETYFRYSSTGWQRARAADCAGAQYVDWIMLPAEHRPETFPLQSDGAAAARAVACVSLVKAGGQESHVPA